MHIHRYIYTECQLRDNYFKMQSHVVSMKYSINTNSSAAELEWGNRMGQNWASLASLVEYCTVNMLGMESLKFATGWDFGKYFCQYLKTFEC